VRRQLSTSSFGQTQALKDKPPRPKLRLIETRLFFPVREPSAYAKPAEHAVALAYRKHVYQLAQTRLQTKRVSVDGGCERLAFRHPPLDINKVITQQEKLQRKLERTGRVFKFVSADVKLVRHVLEHNGFIDSDEALD
jgi:hypothetical protein